MMPDRARVRFTKSRDPFVFLEDRPPETLNDAFLICTILRSKFGAKSFELVLIKHGHVGPA